jgi:hypothetical protein
MTTPALRHHAPAFLAAVLLILGPPAPPRRLSEVAGSLRITEGRRGPRPEAPHGDLLDVNEHHGWRAALRLCASMLYRIVVVLGPPQDGKDTNVSSPLITWALNDLRCPVVYATTDKRLMGALWRAKVEATMKASGYAHLFPDDGMGSNGGTPDEILFNNGVRLYLLGAGASNGAGQAAVSFEPPLRVAPSNGGAIVTAAPTAKFILSDDAVRWTHEPARLVTGHRVELTSETSNKKSERLDGLRQRAYTERKKAGVDDAVRRDIREEASARKAEKAAAKSRE